MPKVKQRKKNTGRKSPQNVAGAAKRASSVRLQVTDRTETGSGTGTRTVPNPSLRAPAPQGVQSLIFPGMVTLGCWGMAFSFVFLSTDPNHVLFGGMAALMGVLWTISFVVRMRKIMRRSQISRAG
jgi:hypothetical protein